MATQVSVIAKKLHAGPKSPETFPQT